MRRRINQTRLVYEIHCASNMLALKKYLTFKDIFKKFFNCVCSKQVLRAPAISEMKPNGRFFCGWMYDTTDEWCDGFSQTGGCSSVLGCARATAAVADVRRRLLSSEILTGRWLVEIIILHLWWVCKSARLLHLFSYFNQFRVD